MQMAASKSYFAGAQYRFLPIDQSVANDSMMFEFEESDVWNSEAARSQSPDFHRSSSRISPKPALSAVRGGAPASLPVKVPDWSKILKDEFRDNRPKDRDDDDYDDEDAEESGHRIPPHEFLARKMARRRIVPFSVHEGFGRALKGRDLSRVRNAIWQKTGFQD